MSRTYYCEKPIIEKALDKLKADGLVAQEASFNYDAPQNLRSEVAYRDFDFLSRLSRIGEMETTQSILNWLKETGIAPETAVFNSTAFEALQKEVKEKFVIAGTSISPVMALLLYLLSTIKQPQRIIGLGTYYGYALVWAVGASCGLHKIYNAEAVLGIDIDESATKQAQQNFSQLANAEHIALLTEDGLEAVEKLEGPFDYVYLDVDSKEVGKGLYLKLLQRLYAKIAPAGWVLAHDTVVPPFAKQLKPYLAFVRDNQYFAESISFHVDAFGLELSIK